MMHQIRGLFFQSLVLIWLGLAYRLTNAAQSCPLITIDDLGSTAEFSSSGLVARAIVPLGEAIPSIPARIRNFTKVCDAAGERINTSSFVSVVVEFQCNFVTAYASPSLAVCSDPNNIVTRQYQFQCTQQSGQPVWGTVVSSSNQFVETLNPTATLSTPLANQCRRCIDDRQSSRADPTTHCDPCPSLCNQGQRRCFLGQISDICCNFYLQNNCTEECPGALVADSNSICVCPPLNLDNGDVSYSPANRGIGSVATHTCSPGYQLSSPQAEVTRTCSVNGWSNQNFTCEQRARQAVCRASVNCAGGPGDDLGVAASGENCCLDNPAALAYSPLGSETCIACVVVGFLNTTFSGFEQGPSHSVPVGYLKGGTEAGQNLVFNVDSTPGTAREGSQFDYSVSTLRTRALANGQIGNVVITFRVDSIALEPNETFTLTLDPLIALTPREGLFFQNTIEVTIIDSDNVEFAFTEDDFRVIESDASGSPTFLPVLVSKSTRIASRVELVVVPLTIQEAMATSLPLPPNIPADDIRPPPFASLNDFNNTNITIIFEPDEGAEVNEKRASIFIIDDAISEAEEEVFVVELRLIDTRNAAAVDLTVRPSALCRIIDNDQSTTVPPGTTVPVTTLPSVSTTVPPPQPPPPAPLGVQGLCSFVVWYSPVVQSCEDIHGYEVRLYNPQSSHPNVTSRVGANGTFYMVDEEKLPNSHETYIQVRVIHRTGVGKWSEGTSLGCEKPTVPEKPPRVHFELNGKVYRNNSAIALSEVGEGTGALYCRTDKEECCGTVPNRFGQFYYPNGVQVPIGNRQQGFYRNRGNQIIRLNRREGITSPTGTYRCEIPNADDEIANIYITLTGN